MTPLRPVRREGARPESGGSCGPQPRTHARHRKALPLLALAAVAANALPAVTAIPPLWTLGGRSLAGAGRPDRIALTFDDGPDPRSTPAFLELLGERGITATFFLLGRMVRRAPGLARHLVESGHEVALHGDQHRCLLLRDPKSTMDDLRRGRDTVADATGVEPVWFRPPYGVLTTAALLSAHRLRLQPVLWTAWGRDWSATATPDSITRTVQSRLRPGGTVLLHDSDCTSAPGSWRRTLAALPGLLDHCAGQGWSVGPLREHVALRRVR